MYHYIIREDGQPMYLGHRNSVLYFNGSVPSWVWYDRKDSRSVAVSNSPEASLFLGVPTFYSSLGNVLKGVHYVDFSGVRDDKCQTGDGQSQVNKVMISDAVFSSYLHVKVKAIKLTTCSEGEFTCNDGQCIVMEQRKASTDSI